MSDKKELPDECYHSIADGNFSMHDNGVLVFHQMTLFKLGVPSPVTGRTYVASEDAIKALCDWGEKTVKYPMYGEWRHPQRAPEQSPTEYAERIHLIEDEKMCVGYSGVCLVDNATLMGNVRIQPGPVQDAILAGVKFRLAARTITQGPRPNDDPDRRFIIRFITLDVYLQTDDDEAYETQFPASDLPSLPNN